MTSKIRGADAPDVLAAWERRRSLEPDQRHNLRAEIADLIERAFRYGCDVGTAAERDRVRKVLGL